jgi:hypothetical protein
LALSLGKLFEQLDKRFETETLDEFHGHLEASLRWRQKSLDEEYFSLTVEQFEDPRDIEGYRAHLEDKMAFSGDVQHLADELSVVALYKQVELHTKRVAKRNFPNINEKELFKIETLKKALPFDLEALPDFQAFDELRLINNAIKHEGKVSEELARKFKSWNEGNKLENLGAVYTRLLPSVKSYVKSFVTSAYANSHKF